MRSLADYAARRDQSRSLVAEAAIASFLSRRMPTSAAKPPPQSGSTDGPETAATKRDIGISVEMLAVFIRFWLASTPQLPDSAQAAARAKAGERYDSFFDALGRRLAKGPRLLHEIAEEQVQATIHRRRTCPELTTETEITPQSTSPSRLRRTV